MVYFSKDIEDAKRLGIVLSRYKDRYYPQVLCGVAVTYLFLQVIRFGSEIFLRQKNFFSQSKLLIL